ncbi:hypothetical protein BKP37_03035 [Anaerobacillus alkalilacustris]|uniref:Uncharacterized protein n=1 Tax=Anaerobacillus alkalilacustris TaxID=393763 RepID=A0A1S2LZ39_9BACI|nr:DUF5696 domain-containing protein [Anaerobacillus alkalilacustris]OIJ17483.1 hypothetical protein BKP37_03035 [Anaerobacillus alkalilacustris]
MVDKYWKYGVALLVVAILGASFFINTINVPYGIAVAQDNFRSVTVNDQMGICTNPLIETNIPERFKKLAENEQLELYLEEETLAIAVRDKCNGYTWFSYDVHRDLEAEGYSQEMIRFMKSGISLITYDRFTPGRRTVMDSKVEKTYEMLEDGFRVAVDFTEQQIKFDAIVTLQGGDLLFNIPQESVVEYNPDLWRPGNNNISMNDLIIYPFFGSATHKEDGYIVIPDGSGAIINLKETPTFTTGYSASVYGRDMGYENNPRSSRNRFTVKPLERVSLPIFGIIHEVDQAGLLVISESGSSYATYNYRSRDTNTDYYQSYFTYNYRTAYAQFQSRVNEDQYVLGFQPKPNQFDLVQRYVFLNGEQANYVGVAKNYRDLLEKKDALTQRNTLDFENIPMKIDFINNEVTMGTLGMENVSATTYRQAKEVTKSLLEKGYNHLNVSFKTFIQKDRTYKFDVLRNLGGKNEFEETLQFFADNDIAFQYYVDYAQSYFDKTKYTANKMNRQDFSVWNHNLNVINFMNNPKFFTSLAEKDMKNYQKHQIGHLALESLSGSLFTHYDKGTIGSSVEGMEYTKNLLQYFHDHGIRTSMYTPDAYLFSLIDDYFDTPITSSELQFVDATIPLVSLVLSGYKDMYSPYMNFSSNDQESILKLIEFGVYPSFVLTGESAYNLKRTASNNIYVSEMEYLEGRIDDFYQNINESLSEVIGYEMINHRIVDHGIVIVTYSNGKEIMINYNDTDYFYEDVQIKSKGFVIL